MVKSRTELELIATPAASIGGSPGEGTFTVDEDRLQLSPVVLQSVKHRLLLYLQNEDLVGYRVCLNLQTVFLRGLPANPVGDLIPGFDEANVDSGYLAVSRFPVPERLFCRGRRRRAGMVTTALWRFGRGSGAAPELARKPCST